MSKNLDPSDNGHIILYAKGWYVQKWAKMDYCKHLKHLICKWSGWGISVEDFPDKELLDCVESVWVKYADQRDKDQVHINLYALIKDNPKAPLIDLMVMNMLINLRWINLPNIKEDCPVYDEFYLKGFPK